MKSNIRNLILTAVLGTSTGVRAAPVLFPNGDFSSPGGAEWGTASGGAQNFDFPDSGGNPGGYASIESSEGGGYAVLISNGDQPYPLASLGLEAGKTYNFTYDMMTSAAGANKGGVKIESWTSGGGLSNSGDQRVTSTGTGWASYSYQYTIDPAATHIKIVPLWTPNETVGFDNIGVNNTAIVPPPPTPVVPNGDFEIPGGASWAFFQGGGQTVTYPASGGNPGGCAVIHAFELPAWSVIVWNNNAPKTLASLGLTAGQTYTFQQDMKILQGTNIGGMKVDFIPGSTGDIFPTQLIGDGSTWETYSFQITIPEGVTQINVVGVGGPGSDVAFDNFKILLPEPPAAPQPEITLGTMVSWTPTVEGNTYQAQKSPDGATYDNLGGVFTGTGASSVFDPSPAAYYRVLEGLPVVEESIINGSFEDEFLGDLEGWQFGQSQVPELIGTDARTGTNSVRIKVENEASGATANGSEVQQNIANEGGTITPGSTYDFSFWAKQISSGPSYVQQYRVVWLSGAGAELGSSGFKAFSGAVGVWEQKSTNGLLAPDGADSALIQIFGVTGAVDGGFGEVIIDDVSLATVGTGSTSVIAATTAAAAEISWKSITGQSYQVRSSTDLSGWSDLGGMITGNNTMKAVYDTPLVAKKFYQLGTQ